MILGKNFKYKSALWRISKCQTGLVVHKNFRNSQYIFNGIPTEKEGTRKIWANKKELVFRGY